MSASPADHITLSKTLYLISVNIGSPAATLLFIGIIQGLVMQSLASHGILALHATAQTGFARRVRGIRSSKGGA